MSEQDYMEGLEGEGLEGFVGNAVTTGYLSLVQPGSTATLDGSLPGTWRNSATNENYGPIVKVIPLAFKTVWTEREKDPPFATVGRYEPNGIEVRIERPKPGVRGFPKMFNPQSGNKIEELFIYAVMLEDYPEAGVLYFSPTASSMRTCKNWNSLLRSQRLPSGKPAPIFGYSWELGLTLEKNPNQPANMLAKFTSVTRGTLISKAMLFDNVKPALAQSANIALLAAPEKSGELEE
jgi:hypothetical protein